MKRPEIRTDVLATPKDLAGLLRRMRGAIVSDAGLAIQTDENGFDLQPYSPNTKKEPAFDENAVIIAIIDDGIGIANHRFRRREKETRVEHFLDLALVGKPTATNEEGKLGRDELLGRSWTKTVIDTLLRNHPTDERTVYRALGLIDPGSSVRQPLIAAATHGTHVLDTAAGYDWQNDVRQHLPRNGYRPRIFERNLGGGP